jgi:hypothetical protein
VRDGEARFWRRLWRYLVREWDTVLGWVLLAALIVAMLATWFWVNPLKR